MESKLINYKKKSQKSKKFRRCHLLIVLQTVHCKQATIQQKKKREKTKNKTKTEVKSTKN